MVSNDASPKIAVTVKYQSDRIIPELDDKIITAMESIGGKWHARWYA